MSDETTRAAGLTLTRRLAQVTVGAAELWLDWDARRKTRMAAVLSDGRRVWVELSRPAAGQHAVLSDGDALGGPGGLAVRVRASPEALLEVRAEGPVALARCAYHLGNRHAHVQIADGCLRTPADGVMRTMLEQLGATVTEVEAPFAPEVGAYAHQHDHIFRHGQGEARIHSFTEGQ